MILLYVVANMRIMTRMGRAVLDKLGADGVFIPCMHSVGAPLEPGQKDVAWPCQNDPKNKYIVHFPDDPSIWSYGSGYGGNALLGKKCLALRIASVIARKEGWMAEHMLILSADLADRKKALYRGGLPERVRQDQSRHDATLAARLEGDLHRGRHRVDSNRRGRTPLGRQPGIGLLRGGAGHVDEVESHADATFAKNSIFTNVALTPDGDVWWEDSGTPAPATAIDWEGNPWTPDCGRKSAHPNSRFTSPASQCPVIDPEWENPKGVPLSAILFGGRRPATIPLVNEAFDWEHGVFMGSSCGSETTAAALGQAGVLRRDPFAMLPFCGYNMGDYFAHWLSFAQRTDRGKLPRIYFVNWFRKDPSGKWLWPGYGENSRVLKWICERVEGTGKAQNTPIGNLPAGDALDLSGLPISAGDLKQLLAVDAAGWRSETQDVAANHAKFGSRLPKALSEQLDALKKRLG